MYANCDDETSQDYCISILRQSMDKGTSDLTLKDGLFNERYRTATWINIVYMIFHELTGINVINLYSGQMLKEMQGHGGSLTPRQGTYLIGIANCLTNLSATLFTVKHVGRRTLVIYGHFAMAVAHLLLGVFNNHHQDNMVLVMMMLFIVAYQSTSGPVAWIYAAETTIDAALGFCMLTLWGTVVVLSIVCPVLMNSDVLGVSNVFFLLSGFAALAVVFAFFFFKETKGLTDKEKRNLYTPAKYIQDTYG